MWSVVNEKIPQDVLEKLLEIFGEQVVVGESKPEGAGPVVKVVYYSLREADDCGERRHPGDVLRELGYKILEWVGQPILDRVDVRVESFIENPPCFIRQQERPLSETYFQGGKEE